MADVTTDLRVAQVRGVRGLDGTLRLEVLTDLPEQRFLPGARLSVEGSERVLTILEVTPSSPGLFIRVGEVQSRLAGERLVGAYLTIPAAQVQIPPDRVLWDEVIGVTVRDPQGEIIGEVRDLYRAGGAEVYVVQTPDGGEIDLPAVAAVIVEFAPREGRIVADLTGSELTIRAAKAPRRRGPQKTPGSVASLRAAKASRRPKQRSAKPPAGDA
ncbi:MAG: ribosome maturation factor RimM [Chloroflexi bacterium]|nr:ribosome maturation factor RimM [Chloroflexota bacterium]